MYWRSALPYKPKLYRISYFLEKPPAFVGDAKTGPRSGWVVQDERYC
jgi:hypothetical protein